MFFYLILIINRGPLSQDLSLYSTRTNLEARLHVPVQTPKYGPVTYARTRDLCSDGDDLVLNSNQRLCVGVLIAWTVSLINPLEIQIIVTHSSKTINHG